MTRALSVLCAVFALAACSTTTAPSSDLITATPEASALELKNNSSDPVYFYVADKGVLALLDFTICDDPSKCESIAASGVKKIPYSGIIGYSGGTKELVVYHWRLVPKGAGQYQKDSLRTIIVPVT